MSANVYVIEDYENETYLRPKKTNPNKPNSNPIKACPERIEFTLSVIEGNGPISSKAKIACQKIRPHPAPLPSIILLYKCEELGKNTEGLHTDNYAKNKVNSTVFAL
jgi:hypothetical protein